MHKVQTYKNNPVRLFAVWSLGFAVNFFVSLRLFFVFLTVHTV